MQTYFEDILSQPESLRRCLDGLDAPLLKRLTDLCHRPWKQILFTGMGSSNYCAIPAQQYLMQHGLSAMRLSAADLLNYGLPIVTWDTLLVINSQSGESAEVVRLLERLTQPTAVVAVTNDLQSTLAKAAPLCLPIGAEPERSVTTRTYLNSIVLDLLVAYTLCRQPYDALLADVQKTAQAMEEWLRHNVDLLQQVLDVVPSPQQLCLLGRGNSFATACAGSLFLREVCRYPAFYEQCGEFRHGPMEMVDDSFHGILIAMQDDTFPLQKRLAQDIHAHDGHLLVIANEAIDGVNTLIAPPVPDSLSPLLSILPIQLYADHLAAQKGIEAGSFRWGGKITKTE